MNKQLLLLAALSVPAYALADREEAHIRITSDITVDKECASDLLKRADEDGKKLNAEYASLRGVSRAETTIEKDDAMRCSECGAEVAEDEGEVSEEGNRKCSSCCSSCTTCCK